MKIKDSLTVGGALLLTLLASNIVVPLMACGFPRIKNLLLLKIKDVNVEYFPADEDENPNLRVPECIDIKYNEETLTINLEDMLTNRVVDMSPISFGIGDNSGSLGLIFLGIPGSLLFSPVIILCNLAWKGVYKLTGMDVNYYLFFQRIKNNLDADTRLKLEEALKNTSRNEAKYYE